MEVLLLLLACRILAVSSQSGFTSLSCGGNTGFSDERNISWLPDSPAFVSTGFRSVTRDGTQKVPVRYFPLSSTARNLNCFQVPVAAGSVIARAVFTYGNYDKLQQAPAFQFVLNQTIVSSVNLSASDPWVEEVIWTSEGGTTSLCLLAKRGEGARAPVISSLELRPLPLGAYKEAGANVFLRKHHRINCGQTSQTLRYPSDPHDRIWDIDHDFFPRSSTFTRSYSGLISSNATAAPLPVLQTSRGANGSALSYVLNLSGSGNTFLVLYFATLFNTTVQETVNVFLDGAPQEQAVSIPRSFVAVSNSYSLNSSSSVNITLQNLASAPELNGLEVYRTVKAVPPTSNANAGSLSGLLASYTLQLPSLTGDPCLPVPWNEVSCTSDGNPEVISLDLSNKGLIGSINPTFGDLSELKSLNLSHNRLSAAIPDELGTLESLETLDLSFNELSGPLPEKLKSLRSLKVLYLQNNNLSGPLSDALGQLSNLQTVNIMNNNFSGPIPASLTGKIQFDGNPCIGTSSCSQQTTPPAPAAGTQGDSAKSSTNRKRKTRTGMIVGIAIGGSVVVLLLAGCCCFFLCKRKKPVNRTAPAAARGFFKSDPRSWGKCREFTYKELNDATNGFRTELGKGSFGPVYRGKLADGQEVAIKVRSDVSKLGDDAFINEVSLLSRVHHQNLVSLVGFCQKPKKQLLVYEYMAGGSLMDRLYGDHSQQNPLDWKARVSIAAAAAAGLDYLHNGSDPKIIHRDVKSSNILIDSSTTAKVSDFGLSRNVANVDATHVTTMVKGTTGYVDPEYYASNQLTEKSDVYSFGVVLLEIICGREVLSHSVTPDQFSIIAWAKPLLETGAYNEAADRHILGQFDEASMQIVSSIACRAVEREPQNRPVMNEVMKELKRAVAT